MKMLVAICLASVLCACVPRAKYFEVLNTKFAPAKRADYYSSYKSKFQGVEIELDISSTFPHGIRVYLEVTSPSHDRITFDLADISLEGNGRSFGLTPSTIEMCCSEGEAVCSIARGKNWRCQLVFENYGVTRFCDQVDLWLPDITIVGTGQIIEFEKITARMPDTTE